MNRAVPSGALRYARSLCASVPSGRLARRLGVDPRRFGDAALILQALERSGADVARQIKGLFALVAIPVYFIAPSPGWAFGVIFATPFLVLTQYYLLRALTPLETAGLLAAAFAAALLSYRYVETPFRRGFRMRFVRTLVFGLPLAVDAQRRTTKKPAPAVTRQVRLLPPAPSRKTRRLL